MPWVAAATGESTGLTPPGLNCQRQQAMKHPHEAPHGGSKPDPARIGEIYVIYIYICVCECVYTCYYLVTILSLSCYYLATHRAVSDVFDRLEVQSVVAESL